MQKNEFPLVSIIMLTYKHELYIEQAIRSVLMQKYKGNFELIISNDNSPDNTDIIIKTILNDNLSENRVKYTLHSENLGMIPNFLWSLRKAKGKYVAICEGDDYWIDELKLQKQVDFLELNQDFGLVFTDSDIFYQRTGRLIKNYDSISQKKIPTGQILSILLNGNPFITCTSMFRLYLIQDLLSKASVNEPLFKMGDYLLWIHIASKSMVGYINNSTSVYRVLESSASHFSTYIECKNFEKSKYKLKLFLASTYNVSLNKKLQKVFVRNNMIKFCIINNNYRQLVFSFKELPVFLKLFIKEKIFRPLFKLSTLKKK